MGPETIIARVKAKYLECDTYSDEGIVSTDRADEDGLYTNKTEFKTYYARPNKVRFEWEESRENRFYNPEIGKNVIWSNGINTNGIFLGRKRQHESLSMAMAAATGVSKSTVNLILQLLLNLDSDLRWFWTEMKDTRLTAEEEVGGFRCHHIVGSTQHANDVEAWIAQADYVVRKLRRKIVLTSEFREFAHKRGIEALRNAGVPQEQIDEVIAVHIASRTPDTHEHYHDYIYYAVRINEPISEALFNSC